jgi:hypothetical protein
MANSDIIVSLHLVIPFISMVMARILNIVISDEDEKILQHWHHGLLLFGL